MAERSPWRAAHSLSRLAKSRVEGRWYSPRLKHGLEGYLCSLAFGLFASSFDVGERDLWIGFKFCAGCRRFQFCACYNHVAHFEVGTACSVLQFGFRQFNGFFGDFGFFSVISLTPR